MTLTDEGTNIAENSVTNGSGIYLFTGVRPGAYTIRVEASGLAPQERKALRLAVSQSATLNLTLKPQSVSEVVTVSEQAELLTVTNPGKLLAGEPPLRVPPIQPRTDERSLWRRLFG